MVISKLDFPEILDWYPINGINGHYIDVNGRIRNELIIKPMFHRRYGYIIKLNDEWYNLDSLYYNNFVMGFDKLQPIKFNDTNLDWVDMSVPKYVPPKVDKKASLLDKQDDSKI